MTFEGKEYDVARLLNALEEGNGDANPKSVFLFFFCRTSLWTRGAGAVEVSLLGLMTKAAFDRGMGCHLFLQMLPVGTDNTPVYCCYLLTRTMSEGHLTFCLLLFPGAMASAVDKTTCDRT